MGRRGRGAAIGVGLAAVLSAALAALAAGCGRPPRRAWEPPPLEPGDAPAAFAVVRAGAPLHVAPDGRASTVVLPAEGFVPLRVLREADDWVWLETLGAPDRSHCAPAVEALEPFRLRLYARPRDLVPVTVREVTQRFDDGTFIHLARGVPLEALPGERAFRAHLGPASTVVRLEPTAVGTRYLPSPPPEVAAAAHVLSGGALVSGVAVLGRTGRLAAHAPVELPVHARAPRGGEQLVEVRTRCARVGVRVPARAVQPPGVVLARVDGAPGPPFVTARSPVFWANGQRAGAVVRRAPVRDEIDPVQGRRCFRHPLGRDPATAAAVILCFRPHDVIDAGPAAGRRLDPPG
jgi:hypothetical protein